MKLCRRTSVTQFRHLALEIWGQAFGSCFIYTKMLSEIIGHPVSSLRIIFSNFYIGILTSILFLIPDNTIINDIKTMASGDT